MEMFFIDEIQSEVVTLHTMNTMAVLIHNLRTIWGDGVSGQLHALAAMVPGERVNVVH